MTDLLITGATVYDGSGAPGVRADVAVSGGRIVAIGNDLPAASSTVFADGLALSPGFIDMHAHSDLQILANPDHLAKVSQGVTLEVLGQDGLSFAPIDEPTRAAVRRQIAGWNGEPDDFDFSWSTVAGYLDRLDQGIACNAAYLIPQGTLRMMVVGTANRPATRAELDEMKRLLAVGLSEGAVGDEQRAHIHTGDVRRHRRTGRALPCRCVVRRVLQPAPALVREGRFGGVRRDDRRRPASPAARCISRTRR